MNKYLSEFMGTFALVFAGTGAIIVNDVSGGVITHVGVALVFGLIITTMVYAVGDISGAHLNPAVTIGFWVSSRFPAREVAPYIGSQVGGALLASFILWLVFPGQNDLGVTLPSISLGGAFVFEFILTFFLMFVIINVAIGAKETGIMAGLAIGATVGLDAMFGGPVTGASMNPARSLAPALFSAQLSHLWLYIVAPIFGAIVAVLCWRIIRDQRT